MIAPHEHPSTVIGDNVVHFGRILRAAGFAIGPDRISSAMQVLAVVGVRDRNDMHSALASVLVDRRENQPLFDAAFQLFWDHAGLIASTTELTTKRSQVRKQPNKSVTHSRLSLPTRKPSGFQQDSDSRQPDSVATFSARDRLCEQDFESMTAEEFQQASRLVRDLNLPLKKVVVRRKRTASQGKIDLRGTLQGMVRQHDTLQLAYYSQFRRAPPLVILLDISGSMERYARMFLHFVHGLTCRFRRVDTLVFGTRLTNITRCLKGREVDTALWDTSQLVPDWSGGTRIGTSLREFNRLWARRLLGGNATLILVSDGLDCDEGNTLTHEAELLRRFARQIIWLNPLLRFERFEPRAAGVRTLLPLADHFLPVHNVNSLVELGEQLARTATIKQPRY